MNSAFLQIGTKSSKAEYEKHFAKVAKNILNNYILWINKNPFRIIEIEFYLNCENHPDTFTHNDSMQKQRGIWYFHKMGKSYRDGTYKGLDLAFGQGDGSHGGILLRAMIPLEKKSLFKKDQQNLYDVMDKSKAVIGPCNLVNKILELNSKEGGSTLSISQLVEKKEFSLNAFKILNGKDQSVSISDDKKQQQEEESKQESKQQTKQHQPSAVYLEQYDHIEEAKILSSPRVGLSLKRMDKNKHKHQYIMKSYRYFTHPELIHKGKNLMSYPLINQGLSAIDIAEKIGATKKSIESFIGAFESGKEGQKTMKSFENKSLGNEELAKLYGVWSKSFRDERVLEEEQEDQEEQQVINL